jgi:hypothetical protein
MISMIPCFPSPRISLIFTLIPAASRTEDSRPPPSNPVSRHSEQRPRSRVAVWAAWWRDVFESLEPTRYISDILALVGLTDRPMRLGRPVLGLHYLALFGTPGGVFQHPYSSVNWRLMEAEADTAIGRRPLGVRRERCRSQAANPIDAPRGSGSPPHSFPPCKGGPSTFPPFRRGGQGGSGASDVAAEPPIRSPRTTPKRPLTAPAHHAAARLRPISTTWSQRPSPRRPTSPCAPAPASPSPHVRESTLAAVTRSKRPVARVPSEVVLPASSNLRLRPPPDRPPELGSFSKNLGSFVSCQVPKSRPNSSELQ